MLASATVSVSRLVWTDEKSKVFLCLIHNENTTDVLDRLSLHLFASLHPLVPTLRQPMTPLHFTLPCKLASNHSNGTSTFSKVRLKLAGHLIGKKNDTVCRGLATLTCPPFLHLAELSWFCQSAEEKKWIPSNVAKRHFTAASLLICISALALISGPGSYSGDFNTPMRIVWSQSHHINSDVGCYETHRHTQWEVGTNCCIRLSVSLKPPERCWVTTSWGQIICRCSSLLVFVVRWGREKEACVCVRLTGSCA